jgi:CRP/FNR family cyclic AMP-dependent transcriptional regulator
MRSELMKEMRFNAGDTILAEGTFGDSAFILKEGSVEVKKKTQHEDLLLATLEAEDIFGEMGLIEDKPRSATIVAKNQVVVAEITRDDFMGLLDDKKSVIIPILRAFFERLRQTNDLVVRLENEISRSSPAAPDAATRSVYLVGLTNRAQTLLGNKKMEIKKFPFKIGRESSHASDAIFANNDLYILDEIPYNISKNHMSINLYQNQYYILDRGSSIGTIVNGKTIGGKVNNYKITLDKGENTVIIGSSESPYQFQIII